MGPFAYIGLGLLLLLCVALIFAPGRFARLKLPPAFLLRFIGCWGISYCLIRISHLMIGADNPFNLTLSFVQRAEVAGKIFSVGMMGFIFVPLVFALISFIRPKLTGAIIVRVLGILGCIFALVMSLGESSPAFSSPSYAATVVVKSSLHGIEIALERYSNDHRGQYPGNINDLISQKYISAFPQNPFSTGPMQSIKVGDPGFEGNFTYEPVTESAKVTGFRLIAYGSRNDPGQDINLDGIPDHAVLVLQNPTGPEHY